MAATHRHMVSECPVSPHRHNASHRPFCPLTADWWDSFCEDWTVSNIEEESVGARVLLPDIIIYNGPSIIVSVLSISCLVLFSFWVLSGLWRLATSRVVKESL